MSEIRPQFFLVRKDDTIVPLIALDELPTDISIQGVPRKLSVSDTRGMTSVGTVPSRGVCYVVEGLDNKHGSKHKEKVYCSFWIRTGSCNFEQQGCRYKHIMPTDLETLKSIGFPEIPAWYREQYNLPKLRPSSNIDAGYTQNNWRKPRAAPMKAIEHSHGKEKNDFKSGKAVSETKTITPAETSVAGKTVTEGQVLDDTLDEAYKAGLDNTATATTTTTATTTNNNTTNGSSPVTPPNVGRFIDFERIGNGSFIYKYGAPQTPTGSGRVRSRRLYDSNREYSTSPDTIPSMTNTVHSCSPSFSSLGGTPRSTTGQPPVNVTYKSEQYGVAEADFNAADDTLDNLSNELAHFDTSEPKYRSISELLDSSIPEDRYGNLILF